MLLINDKKAIEKYNLEQHNQNDNNVFQETESERYIHFLRVILVILKIIFIIVGIVIASRYFSMSEQEKLLTSITNDIFISFMLIYVITCIAFKSFTQSKRQGTAIYYYAKYIWNV